MTVETDVIEKPDDVPAPTPDISGDAPAPEPTIDDLLNEYDRSVQQPEPESSSDNAAPEATLDDQFRELFPDPRISELQGQVNNLQAVEFQRQSRADFEGFAKKLQAELGPNVPDDYAKTQLLAMSAENPDLEVAWRYRNLTSEQRTALDREFQQLEVLYHQAQQAPDDPRKATALAQMEARGREIGLALNAGKMLDRVWRDVQKRAAAVKPAVDSEQTALRQEISGLMRSAGRGLPPAEPPPNFGKMSGPDGRRAVLERYGFDPGW